MNADESLSFGFAPINMKLSSNSKGGLLWRNPKPWEMVKGQVCFPFSSGMSSMMLSSDVETQFFGGVPIENRAIFFNLFLKMACFGKHEYASISFSATESTSFQNLVPCRGCPLAIIDHEAQGDPPMDEPLPEGGQELHWQMGDPKPMASRLIGAAIPNQSGAAITDNLKESEKATANNARPVKETLELTAILKIKATHAHVINASDIA